MNIVLRFTLENTTKGNLIIQDPIGYEEMELALVRSSDFFSGFIGLNSEFSELDLSFYGEAYDYILDVESTQGINAEITLKVELSNDGGASFNNLGSWDLDLKEITEEEDADRGKIVSVPLRNKSFYQKFLDRRGAKVDFSKGEDFAGGSVTDPVQSINFHSQTIRYENTRRTELSDGTHNVNQSGNRTVWLWIPAELDLVTEFGEWEDTDVEGLDDVASSSPETASVNWSRFIVRKPDELTFNVPTKIRILSDVNVAFTTDATDINTISARWYYAYSNGTPQAIGSATSPGISGTSGSFRHAIDTTVTISNVYPTEDIRIFLEITYTQVGVGPTTGTDWTADADQVSPAGYHQISIFSDVDDSQPKGRQAYWLHDAFSHIIQCITETSSSFYSEYLGNEDTLGSYVSDGNGSWTKIAQGRMIGANEEAGKTLFASFDDLWSGANPVFNLGLFFDDDNTRLRIEPKHWFFTKSSVLTLDDVPMIRRTKVQELFYTSVETGFNKWKTEELANIQDFNTKHEYSVFLETGGQKKTILSDFVAAGSAIEFQKRRGGSSRSKRFDDDIFIIAMDNDTGAGQEVQPETPNVNPAWGTVQNLLFPDVTYNLRFTPARALLMWGNILNVIHVGEAGEVFRFQNGEGNIKLRADLNDSREGSFNQTPLSEEQDVQWDYTNATTGDEQDPLFKPNWYEFEYPLSYSDYVTLLNNRRNSIKFSSTKSNYIEGYIWELRYRPFEGIASFKVIEAY